ncbi:MAG: hypothetical protein ACLRFK_00795 [Alphaproteobacteria bacterium]
MKRIKLFLIIGIILCALVGITVYLSQLGDTWPNDKSVDTNIFKPYIPNTEIIFSRDGNSSEYILMQNGWGGQEPKHRCMIGKQIDLNLYVKNGKNSPLILGVSGFGVFDTTKYSNQEITVFANGTQIDTWHVSKKEEYTASIPAYLMKDDTLNLRFVIHEPYTPKGDTRKIGMAVQRITLTKKIAGRTRVKIGKWLKNKLASDQEIIISEEPEDKSIL